jgi:putative SOS response-associated peptidase YedK
MPVILTTAVEVDLWLSADTASALKLQRPLPNDALRIVASGEKEDGPREAIGVRMNQEPMLPL